MVPFVKYVRKSVAYVGESPQVVVFKKSTFPFSGSLFDNICRLKTQVLKVKQEKIHIEEKMKLIEVQLISLGHKNETLEKENVVSLYSTTLFLNVIPPN